MRMVIGRMTRKTWFLHVRRQTWKKVHMTLKQTRPQKQRQRKKTAKKPDLVVKLNI